MVRLGLHPWKRSVEDDWEETEDRKDEQEIENKIQIILKQLAMEEKKQKLSYEDLKKYADDVTNEYNKLMREYRGAVNALNNIDATNFFLNAAFKVLEHPEFYSDNFITLCSGKVEFILTKFAENMEPEQEEKREAE